MARSRTYSLPHPSPWKQGDTYIQDVENMRAIASNMRRTARQDARLVGVNFEQVATGTSVDEVVLAEISLPLGLLGPNHGLRVTARGFASGSAGQRVVTVFFGEGDTSTDTVIGSFSQSAGTAFIGWNIDGTLLNDDDGLGQQTTFTSLAVASGGTVLMTLGADTGTVDTTVTPAGRASPEAFIVYVVGQTANAADDLSGISLEVLLLGEL